MAGRKRSAGFGSIDENVNSRSLEDQTDIDVSASIDWGRFFPEKAGVRLPMYYGYSKSTVNPKYNPLEPDIELDQSLSRLETKSEKDSLKSLVQDVVVITSYSIHYTKLYEGLIPFKLASFERGVNYTAGLPVIRTSPAHGTAYALAGEDKASPESFRQALYLAIDIYKSREIYEEITSNPLRKYSYNFV